MRVDGRGGAGVGSPAFGGLDRRDVGRLDRWPGAAGQRDDQRDGQRLQARPSRHGATVAATGPLRRALRAHGSRPCRVSIDTTTDIPGRSRGASAWSGSIEMRTAMRCATFTKLPVALSALSTRELGTGRGREVPARARGISGRPKRVGAERHRLADAHVARLRLLEVGDDPRVMRHEEEQLRAGRDVAHRSRTPISES